jgi:HSP20 family molecular chaperone IbpA
MDTGSKKGILISLASFFLGGIMTYFVLDYIKVKDELSQKHLNQFTGKQRKHIPVSTVYSDPFDQIDRFHSQMRSRMSSLFSDTLLTDSSPVDIHESEDSEYKYIQISGSGVNPKDIDVEIAEGMIHISGVVEENKNKDQNGLMAQSSFRSQFRQSFNVPDGVEESGVKIEGDESKIVIKFPRRIL